MDVAEVSLFPVNVFYGRNRRETSSVRLREILQVMLLSSSGLNQYQVKYFYRVGLEEGMSCFPLPCLFLHA